MNHETTQDPVPDGMMTIGELFAMLQEIDAAETALRQVYALLVRATPANTINEQLAAATTELRQSEEGRAALKHVHALLEGPPIDPTNQRRALTLLVGAWTGRPVTVPDFFGPKLPRPCSSIRPR